MDPNPFRQRRMRWPWRTNNEVLAEVDEELRGHIERRSEALVAQGLSADEARRRAIAQFGDVATTRRYCVAQGIHKEHRQRRRLLLDELRQDVLVGCRRLWKTRALTGVAVVTLALGIGATTAVFSLVNAALLRPLPYGAAARLVLYYEAIPKADLPKLGVSPADFLDLAREQRTSERLAIFENTQVELGGGGSPERAWAARVSPAVFRVLDVAPLLGRAFRNDEDRPGSDLAVISYRLWQRRFGGRPDIVGQTVTLDRRPFTIVGVMPRGFEFPLAGLPFNGHASELWTPFVFTDAEKQVRGGMYHHGVVGRLKPGQTIDQARAELNVLVARTFRAYPIELRNSGLALTAQVVPLADEAVGDIRLPLLLMLAAVALVMFVACANVAGLLVSRAAARQHEMLVMSALGASRGRLRQMLLTESAILGVLAGAVGLALAWATTAAAPAALPDQLARLGEVTPDARVVIFTFGLSLATALLFGMIPAATTRRDDIQSALRATTRSATASGERRLMQQALAVTTVTLAVVLLVGAGLLVRSFAALVTTDSGIRSDHVLTATVALPSTAYDDGTRVRTFYGQAIDRLRALPGVQAAAASSDLPLAGREHLAFTPETSPVDRARLPLSVAVTWPLGDYFTVFGIRLTRGRLFDARDGEGSLPAAIVSQSFARRVWPGQDPIGKRFKWGIRESAAPWLTVVGVVGDVKDASLDTDASIHAYQPYEQLSAAEMNDEDSLLRATSVSLRTGQEPASLGSSLRREISALDPALALSDLQTMEMRMAAAKAPQRLSAIVMIGFALAALMMAAVGIYGILAYNVAQRVREIGIRLALGAEPGQVMREVARQGLALAGVGLVLGLAGAAATTRFLASVLYHTTPYDPVTFIAVPLILGAIAVVACYLPARRAARIDPITALRTE